MLSQYVPSISGVVFRSQVFEKLNIKDGYFITVSCSASASATITVLESNGAKSPDLDPLANDDRYWTEVSGSSGTASATSAYALNRGDFCGKYVYVKIDVTGGSMTDVVIHYNQC